MTLTLDELRAYGGASAVFARALATSEEEAVRLGIADWISYIGKRLTTKGKAGWKNQKTGRIVYQAKPPEERSSKPLEPGPKTKAPAASKTPPESLMPKQPPLKPAKLRKNTAQLQALANTHRAALANKNHPLNRFGKSLVNVKVKDGSVKTLMPGKKGVTLSAADHAALGQHHARLGAMAKLNGDKKAGDAQMTVARWHNENAAAAKVKEEHKGRVKKLTDRLGADMDSNKKLTKEKKELYRGSLSHVFSKLSPQALARVEKHVKGGEFHNSLAELTKAKIDGGKLSKKTLELLRSSRGQIGGTYNRTEQKLTLDGGQMALGNKLATSGSDFDKTVHVYSHELTHAIDGPKNEISNSKEWQQAWKEEIVGRKSISKYAATSHSEGMAEFGRLVFTQGMEKDILKQAFPKCMAVWEKHGII